MSHTDLRRHVLKKRTPIKRTPILTHRYEQTLGEQKDTIDSLRDQLEESHTEITRLQSLLECRGGSLPQKILSETETLPEKTSSSSPQFEMSL